VIRALASLSVKNPVAVHLFTLALLVGGILVYAGMPREVFPVFSMQTVEVTTIYPGASPEDVERLVSVPIENELASLEGLEELQSRSQEGVSTVVLRTGRSTDMSRLLADVRAALQSGRLELPDEAEEPAVREVETQFPVIAVYVYGWLPEEDLRALAEDHQRALEELPGVSRVVMTGTREPRIWVEVLPEALERHDLSLDEVGRAVAGASRDLPLGSLERGAQDALLRLETGIERAADLADVPVLCAPDGSRVPLSSVARLSDTHERAVTRARFNGQPTVHMQVEKQDDGDIIDIARAVKDWVAREEPRLPAGASLGINTDLSIYVENRLAVMRQSGGIGACLVLLSLVLFLNLRVALATAFGIPISFVGGILLAGLAGISMNMMTMFALIVVLGMIVDDAIVVGENVFRRMEEGEPAEVAAVRGTAEVGVPVLATILTTCAAFLPTLGLGGTIGEFLRPIPLVVTFCLAVSMIEAFCVLPAHLAHFGGHDPRRRRSDEAGRRWYQPLQSAYLALLARALRWRYLSVTAAVCLAVLLGGWAALWLPFSLFDEFESKIVTVNLRLRSGSSLAESERLAVLAEKRLLAMPEEEIDTVNVLVGVKADDASRWELGHNLVQIWVDLFEGPGRKRSTASIITSIRERLRDLPEPVESVEVSQPQSGPTGRAVDLWVRGPELGTLAELAGLLVADLEEQVGVIGAWHELELSRPTLRLRLRDEARLLGVDDAWLGRELRAAFEGTRYGRVRRGRDDVEIIVKLPEHLRADPEALHELRVSLPGGGRVPLFTLAELVPGLGPATITRDGRERAVRITADIDKEILSGSAVATAVERRFEELSASHPGHRLSFHGDQREMERSLAGLRRALLLSLTLIFVILGSLFRSFLQPLVIMFAIPFASIGMIAGHVLMGRSIGLMSLIGLLALCGVIVNDSLILVDFTNSRRRQGMGLLAALLDSGRLRFRPILLTSITTMLGLLPLTFFAAGESRFLQPMAISLFYGLAAGTVLVLLLVPCAYAILDDLLALVRHPRAALRRMLEDRAIPAHGSAPEA
jgi:multidrug efflux pump subunit AcrB